MAKAKQEEKPERITRGQAANRVVAGIDGKTTLSALAKEADELFVEHGGPQKPIRAATYYVRRALETAEAMGVVRLTRPSDVLVEKVKAGK